MCPTLGVEKLIKHAGGVTSHWLSLTLNKFMRSPEKAHQGLTIHKVLAQYKIKQILVNKAITVD